MSEKDIHHHEAQPLHHDDEDDSPEAFIERIKALYADQKTTLDELIELSQSEPDSERFEVMLDDITYEALYQNAEFAENAKAMRAAGVSQSEQVRIRDRQRELFASYRAAIIREAGLPTEAGLTEMDKAKQNVKQVVEAKIAEEDSAKPIAILEELGILQTDKEGKQRFTYPQGLFPKATDDKWLTYLETVRNHLRIERAVHSGTLDKTELGNADTTRRMAHNAVTRDVDEILGFNQLPDAEWDFAKTRNLLAKMRDSRFPTVETAEKFVTEKAVLEGVIGAHAVRALVTRLSDMHK